MKKSVLFIFKHFWKTNVKPTYNKNFRIKSKIRTEKNKDILLKSKDTEETYYEIEKNYGVYPKRYKIHFPEFGEIKINKTNFII